MSFLFLYIIFLVKLFTINYFFKLLKGGSLKMNNEKLTQIAANGMTKFNIAPKKEAALEQLKAIQKELANIGKEYKLNIISKLDNFRKIAKALQALRVQ